jgi:hypothetical protein
MEATVKKTRVLLMILGSLQLGACASSGFVSTWKAPDAAPMQLRGAKVGAVVMTEEPSIRQPAEDALAHEITTRGAVGVPMHTLLADESKATEETARAAAEKAGLLAVVVMKPTKVEKSVTEKPVSSLQPAYSDPYYGSYWSGSGGYYQNGWATPYVPVAEGTEIKLKMTVSIETTVYSLQQNKLVWAGQSQTTDPKNLQDMVRTLAVATGKALREEGLLR